MGNLLFGREETIKCVIDVEIHGKYDEPLCLAYKTTIFHVGAGVYLRDDGYVLKPQPRGKVWTGGAYYPLTHSEIVAYQAQGALPTPLPPYSIPIGRYAWGYCVWIVFALIMLGLLAGRAWQTWRARHFKAAPARAERARRGSTPPKEPTLQRGSIIQTEGDAFIYGHVKPLLRNGECVIHQAYATDRHIGSAGLLGALFARGLFVVLTTERVIIISTAPSIRGMVLDNRGIETIERDDIQMTEVDDNAIFLHLSNGDIKQIIVAMREKSLSNQRGFLHGVSQILAPS